MTLAELQMELAQVALMYGEDIQVLVRGQDGTLEGGFGAGLRIQLVEMTRVGEESRPPTHGLLVEGINGPDMAAGQLDFKWSDAIRVLQRGVPGAHPAGSTPKTPETPSAGQTPSS